MPSLAELASYAVMLGLMVAGMRYLRDTQPDPNPAIEAREAAEETARLAAIGTVCGTVEEHAIVCQVERREQSLPFVGTDRRVNQMAEDAAAWRRSA